MKAYENMQTKTLQQITRTMGRQTENYKLASAELRKRGKRVLINPLYEKGKSHVTEPTNT